MNRKQFRELVDKQILVLDGATGTNLMDVGMPLGVCPEKWILEHPEKLINLQSKFIEAGSNIVYAPTFTCNRIKLEEYHLEDNTVQMNKDLVALSKEAIARNNYRGYVAGDMTMTGKQLYPIGDLKFETLVDVYKEQAAALIEAEVDLIVVETMMSLQETRAAVIAIREINEEIPVIVSLTYNEDGRTLFGTPPEVAVVTLQGLGADAVGINCSTGPEEMTELVEKMKEYASVPVFAKPNAGMPELVDGKSVYLMKPEYFADCAKKLVYAGASIVGGCCGSNCKHIEKLKIAVRGMERPVINETHKRTLSSERKLLDIPLDGPFLVVGERINPTGKKKLQEELRAGNLDIVSEMAVAQDKNGAAVLDINMGINGIDEEEMMLKAIYEVISLTDLPLCIDSSYVNVVESALRIYPGRALINSVSLEEKKCRPLFKIAKKYGAMCILLPLSDAGLPETLEEKKENVRELVRIALEEGLTMNDLVVDGLVSTVGALKDAGLMTLETIRFCHDELGLPTICGLSNISFGLPERININSAFLTMAIANGLTMAIANPDQDQLVNAALSADLLLNKTNADNRYVMNVRHIETGDAAKSSKGPSGSKSESLVGEGKTPVYEAIINGNKRQAVDEVKKAIEKGAEPKSIIDNDLIPAINRVGELFEEKKFFLPQLISGANAMDAAIEYITPHLKKDETGESKGTVVFASVEGDIHEIGKSLCVLMLRNYGFNVIDLGKDVPKETIVEAAIEHDADIIALSALMTTTMMNMKDVIIYSHEKGCRAKIIIGGAVINQNFADEIKADGYSKDANECVRLVQSLI
ncbi:homocysteine S-methyltransferase family protein [Eubacterium ruminantium]|uniref:homocysteine S-methyltransferase family protein n=1 Tax=Eubacterium ruminantium TaxID=42322 RepID=UPI002479162A|nr:homocysteine S-methyltransferase family protein [Eubacterium ruminantium]